MIDRDFARDMLNPVTIAGIFIVTLALLQFVVFMALDSLHLVSVGNGAGPGLIMFFGFALGAAVVIAGVIHGFTKNRPGV